MDHEQLKEQDKKMWSLGDYTQIAKIFLPTARRVVEAAGIGPGNRVADVGAGTGNLALSAVEAGAEVEASDLTPRMVELGNERCRDAGANVHWTEADAEDLPYEDDRFDFVMSMFAVMFTPRPLVVARELFRVAKPGGKVVLANWTDDSALARSGQAVASFLPEPHPDLQSPFLWGHEPTVRDRLAPYTDDIRICRDHVRWELGTWPEARNFLERNVGSLVAARQSMDPRTYAEMMSERRRFYEVESDTPGRISFNSDFLLIVATKKR